MLFYLWNLIELYCIWNMNRDAFEWMEMIALPSGLRTVLVSLTVCFPLMNGQYNDHMSCCRWWAVSLLNVFDFPDVIGLALTLSGRSLASLDNLSNLWPRQVVCFFTIAVLNSIIRRLWCALPPIWFSISVCDYSAGCLVAFKLHVCSECMSDADSEPRQKSCTGAVPQASLSTWAASY